MIKQIILLSFIAMNFCFISCQQQQSKENDKLPVDVIAVPVKNGWGYEIYVDNKMYIKQDYIPAVSGIHQFANKEQAFATANLVLAKMKQGKKPFLTVEELKTAGINITN